MSDGRKCRQECYLDRRMVIRDLCHLNTFGDAVQTIYCTYIKSTLKT